MRRLKSRLRAGDTVSRATYEAGFNSSRGVYERASCVARHDAGRVPPRRRRSAHRLHDRRRAGRPCARRDDRTRRVRGRAWRDRRRRRARADGGFPERDDRARRRRARDVGASRARSSTRAHARVVAPNSARRERHEFQRRVWDALRAIPAGERRSYAEVAEAIGSPKSSRAVAQACASNRLAVVIPCHRVVRGDGELSGYKWGVQRKRLLLAKESE